jgi:leader peptidase (prepilin peptidase)/N-methyltransferase
VEVLAATLLALLAWRVADPLTLAAFTWLAALGVILGFVDTAVHRLPDRLTLAAFTGTLLPLGAAALLGGRPGRLGIALLCALAVGAFYLLLVLISPAGMGLGDAKAAFSVGLAAGWLGWGAAFLGTITGFVLAGLYATGLLILGRAGRKDHIPHGPFLLTGALAAILLTHA